MHMISNVPHLLHVLKSFTRYSLILLLFKEPRHSSMENLQVSNMQFYSFSNEYKRLQG